MEIQEIQERIVRFAMKRAEKNGFDITPEISFIHLAEELGEVARQLSNRKMKPERFDEENLREEVVDVILESLILARLCNIDLETELTKKIDILFRKHGFSDGDSQSPSPTRR